MHSNLRIGPSRHLRSPITAASSKRVFQLAFLLVSAYFSYKAVVALRALPKTTMAGSEGGFVADRVCLRVAASRNPAAVSATAAKRPSLGDFGLIRQRCPLFSPEFAGPGANTSRGADAKAVGWWEEAGDVVGTGSRCVDYSAPFRADGYFLVTALDAPTALDPIRWSVVTPAVTAAGGAGSVNSFYGGAADGNKTSWVEVGASEWRVDGSGVRSFYSWLSFDTPQDRGMVVRMVDRPGWPWIVYWCAYELLNALGWFAFFALAASGRPRLVLFVGRVFYLAGAVVFVVTAAGFYAAARPRTAAACALDLPAQVVYVIYLFFFDRRILEMFHVAGLAQWASIAFTELYLFPADPAAGLAVAMASAAWAMAASGGTVAIVFAAICRLFRRRLLRRSRAVVLADQARYDRAWAACLSADPDATARLLAIRRHAAALLLPRHASSAFQRSATTASGEDMDISMHSDGSLLLGFSRGLSAGGGSDGLNVALPDNSGHSRTSPPPSAAAGPAGVERSEGEVMFGVVAARMMSGPPPDPPRQCLRRLLPRNAPSPFAAALQALVGGSCFGWGGRSGREAEAWELVDMERWAPFSVDPARPVNSLDQLFVQASCLYPMLLAKVKAWALASGGCFPCGPPGGARRSGGIGQQLLDESVHAPGPSAFLRLADLNEAGPGEAAVEVRWARLKSLSRAVEKVYRAYKKDVSRLVDICRQSIIFEDLGGIAACLAAMRRDGEARVVRVKNRLDPAYDAGASGGYRAVSVNLRLASAEAAALGVESHVCEVQLVLLDFAQLKDDEGHRRYVAFRNLRGE